MRQNTKNVDLIVYHNRKQIKARLKKPCFFGQFVFCARFSSDSAASAFCFFHSCGKTSQNMIKLEVILSRSVKGLKVPFA